MGRSYVAGYMIYCEPGVYNVERQVRSIEQCMNHVTTVMRRCITIMSLPFEQHRDKLAELLPQIIFLVFVNRLYALLRRARIYRIALFWKEKDHVLRSYDSKRHSFERSEFCYRQLVTKAKSDPSAVQ